MKTVAIGNQKGGVAKTTTALTLGAYAANQGLHTLVIDMDGQGHISKSLGLEPVGGVRAWLVDETPLAQVTINVRPNLDIIPNDHSSEKMKADMLTNDFRAYVMAAALESADYDVAYIDMPPSTDLMHVSALVASDLLIIPAKMDFLSVDGVDWMLKTHRGIGRYRDVEPPTIVGVLPTMFDRTTRETVQIYTRLRQSLGADLVLPPIPFDTKVREAPNYGQTVWEYAPRSPGVIGYDVQTREEKNSQGYYGGYIHLCEIMKGWLE